VFRRIFKPKRRDVTRDWRKLYNKELRVIKLRIKWEGHVAQTFSLKTSWGGTS
jgi:hypothetical protein